MHHLSRPTTVTVVVVLVAAGLLIHFLGGEAMRWMADLHGAGAR
jgi:hypothetical protein